jgi:hypothetical protein
MRFVTVYRWLRWNDGHGRLEQDIHYATLEAIDRHAGVALHDSARLVLGGQVDHAGFVHPSVLDLVDRAA